MTVPTTTDIAAKAEHYGQIVNDFAIDDKGIVQSVIRFDPLGGLTDADIPEPARLIPGLSPSALHAYEDAGMTTGAWLAAQSLRFQATQDPDAKRQADAAFVAICHMLDLGEKHGEPSEPGLFPKPYGGKTSSHVSRDQYLYAMTGLTTYRPVADTTTQRQIDAMIARMARYWVDRDYTTAYFKLPAASHLHDFMGGLFLGIVGRGAFLSEDAILKKEYDRLCNDLNFDARIAETLRSQFRAGRTYDGAMYFRQHENPVVMKTMAIDYLWETDPTRRNHWQIALKAFRDDELFICLDQETGRNYFIMGYDHLQDSIHITEPGLIEELENPLGLPSLTWGGRRQTAGSTQTAFSATVIADRLNDTDCRDQAFTILQSLELSDFRGLSLTCEADLPPGMAWQLNALPSCYLVYWQWAYWLGRVRELW